jgi:glucokinase
VIGALEIGGTHAGAALFDDDVTDRRGEPCRVAVDSRAPAEAILARFARDATDLTPPPGLSWGVAMPDPFDYAAGIGRFRDVGKYEALDGVDVGAALNDALPDPARIVFLNDADAFTLGEAHGGAGAGFRRCVGITLGTGVGSGWVVDGAPVSSGPGVPQDGRAWHLSVDGTPLEDVFSRRAIRASYARTTGDEQADVREIAEHARSGDTSATDVLRDAIGALGRALAPCLHAFAADVVVVGGSMARSWDLFGPWLQDALGADRALRVSDDAERAALLGAALTARRSESADDRPDAATAAT